MGDENIYKSGKRNFDNGNNTERPTKQLRELTDAEFERVRQRRKLIHEHAPELVDFITQLQKEGMIDGWRNITLVEIYNSSE